jgi:hypothetical protein
MNIDDALLLLHQQLAGIKGDWMIIGTASLYLAGYPVNPNDIDILCDAVTAKEIEFLLNDYRVATDVKANQKFRSVFSRYNLAGFTIEVMGNLEVNTANGWVLLREHIGATEKVLFNGLTFVLPVQKSQIAIYTLFDRDKDKRTLQLLGNQNLR